MVSTPKTCKEARILKLSTTTTAATVVEESFWLINSDRSRVKRFSINKQNKDKFFEYMFVGADIK